MTFIPTVGRFLVVSLPGEQLRAEVTRVLDRNTAFVVLPQPMTKGHSFAKGDLVAVRRQPDLLNGEIWQAMENRNSSLPPEMEARAAAKPARKPSKKAAV